MKRLSRSFYNRSAVLVAKDLLGCFLIRKENKKIVITEIVETEAYEGKQDLASHASRGRTKRNEPMYGRPGMSYIYLIYGMYWCFNVVTGPKEHPAAVLVRAVELTDAENRVASGPGKLCRYLQIDNRLNNIDLTKSKKLYFTNRLNKVKPEEIKSAKRIGVEYAGKYKDKKWRFYINESLAVSKK